MILYHFKQADVHVNLNHMTYFYINPFGSLQIEFIGGDSAIIEITKEEYEAFLVAIYGNSVR